MASLTLVLPRSCDEALLKAVATWFRLRWPDALQEGAAGPVATTLVFWRDAAAWRAQDEAGVVHVTKGARGAVFTVDESLRALVVACVHDLTPGTQPYDP